MVCTWSFAHSAHTSPRPSASARHTADTRSRPRASARPAGANNLATNTTADAVAPADKSGDTGSSSLGPIIGGVIGGLLAFAVLALVAAMLILRARRRRKARAQAPSEAPRGVGIWHGDAHEHATGAALASTAPAAMQVQHAQQSRQVMGKHAGSPSAGASHSQTASGPSAALPSHTLSSGGEAGGSNLGPEQRSLAAMSTADTWRALGSMPSSGSRVSPSTLPSAMSLTQRRITPAANGGLAISGFPT